MQPKIRPSATNRTIDLLPNEQEISYDKVHNFFNRYKLWIVGLCILVGLVTAGLIAWQYQENQLRERAQISLANAHSSEDLQAVAGDFGGTDAALLALLRLGDEYFQQNQLDRALGAYQTVLDRYPASTLAPSAAINIATIMESSGKTHDAVKTYQRVASSYPQAFQAAQARFAAARLMEQTGQLREARQAYEDFAVAYPQSSWKSEAIARARKINVRLKKAAPKS